MQTLPRTKLPGNQQGATLVVALILMVLISLLGVSGLKSSAVAEKMSGIDYQRNITFQASENAVAIALQDSVLVSKAISTGAPVDMDIDTTDIMHAKANVRFTPTGGGAVFGASLGANGYSGQRIMVTSNSQLEADENIQTTTVHGITRLVPGGL